MRFVNARCCNVCCMVFLWVLLGVYGSRASTLVGACASRLLPFAWAVGRVPGGVFLWVSCGGERDAGGCAFWVWVVSVSEVGTVFDCSRRRASCFLCEWVLVAELYGGAVARGGRVGYGGRGPVVALFRVFCVGGERVCQFFESLSWRGEYGGGLARCGWLRLARLCSGGLSGL